MEWNRKTRANPEEDLCFSMHCCDSCCSKCPYRGLMGLWNANPAHVALNDLWTLLRGRGNLLRNCSHRPCGCYPTEGLSPGGLPPTHSLQQSGAPAAHDGTALVLLHSCRISHHLLWW